MLRQEIVACQKCGSLKELGDDCDCSDEKRDLSKPKIITMVRSERMG